jgi:hypothetical protein
LPLATRHQKVLPFKIAERAGLRRALFFGRCTPGRAYCRLPGLGTRLTVAAQ